MDVSKVTVFRRRRFSGSDGADGGRRHRLAKLARRRDVRVGGLLLVAVTAFGCWLGVEALAAKSNLEQARSSGQHVKEALLQGDSADALRWAQITRSHAEKARDATHSLPWNIASVVPWLGSPFATGKQISDVVLGLTADVLEPAAHVAAAISPQRLLDGGRVNVPILGESQAQLDGISANAARLDAEAEAISRPMFVSAIREARSRLQGQAAEIADLTRYTALAARLAPSMLGEHGTRTYFIAFQTNAEARGTGGLVGGFGVFRLDKGVATVDTVASNPELIGATASVDLGRDFAANYGAYDPTTDFRNSNISSHFPYAAQILRSMWTEQTGMTVDGVIAIDPVALSYVLDAVGPVVLPDGETVTTDNVVELTESTAYRRFPTDQTARKKYLQGIANEVVAKITGPVDRPAKLLDALGRSVSERRIMVWSSYAADQALLEQTPLAHVVPDDPAPYAEFVLNNLAGNKLDYYLRREIDYAAGGCDRDMIVRGARGTTGTGCGAGDIAGAGPRGSETLRDSPFVSPPGTMITSVRLLATTGAKLLGASLNGEQVRVLTGTERNHPIFEVQVYIPAGDTAELSFRLAEPTSPGAPRVPVQPLIDAVTPTISVATCAG